MVKLDLRTMSYIAGGLQIVISLIVGVALIVAITVKTDGHVDESWDFISRHMTIIWSQLILNIVTLVASIFLFKAIKNNNYKWMMLFVMSVAFVAGVMFCFAIDDLIANTKIYSFGTALVKTLDDIVFGVIEFLLAFIVNKYSSKVEDDRRNRINQCDMQELHENGYKNTELHSQKVM